MQNHPSRVDKIATPEGRPVSAACLDIARDRALRLEAAEAERLGVTRRAARPSLARRLRIPAGTLENLLRERVKRVAADVWLSLEAAYAELLRREIERLTHELEMVRACTAGAPEKLVPALENQALRLEALIAEGRGHAG